MSLPRITTWHSVRTESRHGTTLVPRQVQHTGSSAHALVKHITAGEKSAAITAAQLSAYMSDLGRRGGRVSGARRMKNLSDEQRRDIAAKAARAMWQKRRAAEKK